MASFKEFAQRMRLRGQLVEKNSAQTVRKAALVIDQAVVLATPVDTGRARSNWRVSVGAPFEGEVPAPATPQAGAAEALEQGRQAVAGYTAGQGDIFISNNLPYIQSLNDGSSAQAPAGFVEKAVAEAVKVVQGVKLLKE